MTTVRVFRPMYGTLNVLDLLRSPDATGSMHFARCRGQVDTPRDFEPSASREMPSKLLESARLKPARDATSLAAAAAAEGGGGATALRGYVETFSRNKSPRFHDNFRSEPLLPEEQLAKLPPQGLRSDGTIAFSAPHEIRCREGSSEDRTKVSGQRGRCHGRLASLPCPRSPRTETVREHSHVECGGGRELPAPPLRARHGMSRTGGLPGPLRRGVISGGDRHSRERPARVMAGALAGVKTGRNEDVDRNPEGGIARTTGVEPGLGLLAVESCRWERRSELIDLCVALHEQGLQPSGATGHASTGTPTTVCGAQPESLDTAGGGASVFSSHLPR